MTLSQARNILLGSRPYWYTTEDLCIAGEWKTAWDCYTRGLELGRIRLNLLSDTLVWEHNRSNGLVSSKLVYDCIFHTLSPSAGNSLLALIWSGILPTKISCFSWLVLENKVLTWDNLQKKGWIGPGICALCCADEDNIQHIFSTCSVWKCIIIKLSGQFHFIPPTQNDNLCIFLGNWIDRFSKYSACCYLPFFIMWAI